MNLLTFNSKNKGGGSMIKLIELAIGLSNRGWNVYYISPKDFTEKEQLNHYSIVDFPILKGFFYLFQLILLPTYLVFVKKIHFDRIIAFSLLEGIVACIIKKISKNSKAIVALHGDWYTGIELKKWNPLYKKLYIKTLLKLESILFRKADSVIFVSQENYNRIGSRSNIINDKVKIVYNNVNDARVIQLSQVEAAELDEGKIIGFIGNLFAEDKGVEVLIRAFVQLNKNIENINTKLVIIGKGPDEIYLKELCKSLNIEKDVLFTGYLNNPFSYLKSLDIFVLPSLHEGFNLSILEALYCDKVALGSRVGGVPEALLYDELLFTPKNIDELTAKLQDLVVNEKSYQKALNLCKERKDAFTFDWVWEMDKVLRD